MKTEFEQQRGAELQAIAESSIYESKSHGRFTLRIRLADEDRPIADLERAAWELQCWRWGRARYLSENIVY